MSSEPHVFHVLGIESSCDDTGVAFIRNDRKILSNNTHSQLKRHLNHGGIIPMLAKEYHIDNIDDVATKSFRESGLESIDKHVDAIAVTTRPGLEYSLQVGMNYAKLLAKKYSKPLIPIHHMQAHALMPLLEHRSIRFPYITLLLSGGHCLIAICKRFNHFHLLGTSLDNAPGDLLDKIARRCKVRNLGAPFDSMSGGAALELLSRRKNADRFKYMNHDSSLPMLRNAGCDFSFSGYRGSFDALVPAIDELWQRGDRERLLDELGHLAGSIQRAILIQIAKKLQRAICYYRMFWRYENKDAFGGGGVYESIGHGRLSGIEDESLDVVISGGVAANSYFVEGIRMACQEIDEGINVFAPSKDLCSDNGLMIAWNGVLRYRDYLLNRRQYIDMPSDENVIFNAHEMDLIQAQPDSSIGLDIRKHVEMARFPLSRLKNREFKVR